MKHLTYKAKKFKIKPTTLKKELLATGVPNECALCHLNSTWNNKPLILKIYHIDMNQMNNFAFNLRLICPNCQSQLPKRKRLKKAISLHEQMCREMDEEVFKEVALLEKPYSVGSSPIITTK